MRDVLRALKILVVDDFAGMRESIREFLTGAGYVVESAGSGEEALAIVAQDYDFDLVITDIEMPRMGGIELWNRLRARIPRARVIFLSGHAQEIFNNERLLPGEVLSKPPDLGRLEALLQTIQRDICE